MSETAIVSQANPAVTTLTSLYTVTDGKKFAGNIFVANRSSSTDTTYRISLALLGAADSDEQYIAYGETIQAATTSSIGPLILPAGTVVRVYAGAATISFTAVGSEY